MLIKLDKDAEMPFRANPTDAGLDLKSKMPHFSLYPEEMRTVSTGIYVQIPVGYVGLVFSRSGMGKFGITLANSVGVIDSGYRGEIKVMLHNSGDVPFEVKTHDRIAQLVVIPVLLPTLEIFEGTEEAWNNTERGHNGFGSTGKR